MTIKDYEAVNAIRVSDIVKFATSDFDSIVKYFTIPHEQTESIRNGLVAHSLLLRKDRIGIPDDIAVLDYESYRSKEAQKARDEAIDNGLTPILIKQYDKIAQTISKLENDLNQFFSPNECEFEKAFFAKDDFFGDIKGRVDCLQNNSVINDLKVTSQTQFLDKKIFDFGYQLQMYIYMQLANVYEANLVFLNLETKLICLKKLHLEQIESECLSLLQRAKTNYDKFQLYKKGELCVMDYGEYAIPQWAYNYLMES